MSPPSQMDLTPVEPGSPAWMGGSTSPGGTTTRDHALTVESRQVSWWPVHEFLTAVLAQANCGPLPLAGTPAWCELADTDQRKLLALAEAGSHSVLRWETSQIAQAEASKTVAAAEDWPAVARTIRAGRNAYVPRRTA